MTIKFEIILISVFVVALIFFCLNFKPYEIIIYASFLAALLCLSYALFRDQEVYQKNIREVENYKKWHTRKEIAEWEGNIESLDNFWVILPQFLGSSIEFKESMMKNLIKGTQYTYFLFQQADIIALHELNNEIEAELKKKNEQIKNKIRFCYVRLEDTAQTILKAYFYESRLLIAHPHNPDKFEGFRLYSSSESEKNVIGGFKINRMYGIENIIDRFDLTRKMYRHNNIEDVEIENGKLTNLHDLVPKILEVNG